MATAFGQNGGKLTLQEDNLPAAWRLSEKGKTQIKVAWQSLKDVKLLKTETWCKKARDRNIWGRIIKEAKVHKGL
jgi:NAD(P)H-nitrite reductase large subunit